MSQEVLLDANVILRFLLADHDTLSPRAANVFQRAAAGELKLLIPSLIAAECVFTLRSFYKLERSAISSALLQVLHLQGVEGTENEVLKQALTLYSERNVDFADAYLAALGRLRGVSVGSFDRDMVKLGASPLK